MHLTTEKPLKTEVFDRVPSYLRERLSSWYPIAVLRYCAVFTLNTKKKKKTCSAVSTSMDATKTSRNLAGNPHLRVANVNLWQSKQYCKPFYTCNKKLLGAPGATSSILTRYK